MKTGSKYGPNGLFSSHSLQNLQIPEHLRETLAFNLNHTIAQSTWGAYRTGIKKLEQFSALTNTPITLPLSEDSTLAFSAWVLSTGVTSATLETYLSSLRILHLTEGKNPPKERPALLSAVIRGKKNQDMFEKRNLSNHTRLPFTPSMLRLMKLELKDSDRELEDKRMIWAATVIAFNGALRGGEFLSRQAKLFDPATALRGKDISLDNFSVGSKSVKVLKLKLRSEKQNTTGASTIIDIYPSGSSICPIRAFENWQKTNPNPAKELPAFRFKDGSNMTISAFNKILSEIFSPHTEKYKGKVTSHSLRIGLASLIGTLGFSDEQVMASGRWSSRAFQTYLRLPRTKRLQMARAISNLDI